MASEDDDLKQHALSANIDFYDLLGVVPVSQESEIRTAYRKTALKYHPDKLKATGNYGGLSREEALQRFHDLQIAYDVLSDETARGLYDNARRARQEKAEREDALHGRRREMKDELERREREWREGGLKRKREEDIEEAKFQRELARLAEDGKRRRKEREAMLRQEAMAEEVSPEDDKTPLWTHQSATYTATAAKDPGSEHGTTHDSGLDLKTRSLVFRYLTSDRTTSLSAETIKPMLSHRFGAQVEDLALKENKKKVEGQKHRLVFIKAVAIFGNAEVAERVLRELRELNRRLREAGSGSEPKTTNIDNFIDGDRDATEQAFFCALEDIDWASASGKRNETQHNGVGMQHSDVQASASGQASDPNGTTTPSFSFKPSNGNDTVGRSSDNGLVARLKAAQERRMEQQQQRAQSHV